MPAARRLPPLRALEAFVRIVRLGSAKAAAAELGLSPSALSRRVGALEDFIGVIERAVGKPARKVYRDLQPGDMAQTMADTSAARAAFGFEPTTSIRDGLPPVVQWCRDYFGDRA